MENANEIQVDVENEPMNKTYQDKGLYSLLSEVIDQYDVVSDIHYSKYIKLGFIKFSLNLYKKKSMNI